MYFIQIFLVNLLIYLLANERTLRLYIAWKIVIKVSIRNRKAIFGLWGRAVCVGCYHVFVRHLHLCCYQTRKQSVANFLEIWETIQRIFADFFNWLSAFVVFPQIFVRFLVHRNIIIYLWIPSWLMIMSYRKKNIQN